MLPCSDWSGYSVVNPTVLSSKTGGSLAACWANLQFLGAKGYEDIVQKTQAAKIKIETAIRSMDELRLLGNGVVPATAERAFRTLWKSTNW